jgi:hypothetical protein
MRLVSRRKLAKYAAEQLLVGNDAALEEIAGFLVHEKHEREVELLVGMYAEMSPACVSMIGRAVSEPAPNSSDNLAERSSRRECR